jgi:lipoprotein-anchoring transpeptidase ErfK/SrfK
MNFVSRRDFLKLGGLAFASLAFTPFLPEITQFEDGDLVRVATSSVSVYRQPSDKSQIVLTWTRDSLIRVYNELQVPTPGATSKWYQVYGGYINAARLQKVHVHYNTPLETIPDTNLLAEVTVPYAQPYIYNEWQGWQAIYRLYYSTVHWITGIETGPDGKAWYRIQDEQDASLYYVPAVQMRPIPAEEISPISPDVPVGKKRIEVNLSSQFITCYEYDKVVFTTNVSTGQEGLSLNESTATPVGQFNIRVKMPSKHMGNANLFGPSDEKTLPGIPWVCFFTERGDAFHGTYWHDNFGFPMSHGCVNMRSDEAKWVFRWTQPPAAFEVIDKTTHDRKGYGTIIDVHY